MSIGIAATIGMIATVAAIVLLYVKVLPKKYDGKLDNKYLQWLHNYFNFKRLYMDINKDGYPEHVVTNLDEDMCIIYTIYKSKIRRYVFKNASVSRYKKQFLITTNYDNDDSGIQILESKFYNVVKGKLVSNPKQKLTDVNDWLNGYESKYLKAGKEISIDAYYKIFNKQKRLKSSSYWSKLFNATKNFS